MATGWSPYLLPYLAAPHRPTWRVSAHHADLPDGAVVLDVTRLQLSWDESRAPRVQLAVDVVAPTDPAVDALLDPRTAGLRIHVHAGHLIGGVDDRVLVADLGLRVRGVDATSGQTTLDAQSDEALVMDAAPSGITSGLASNSSRGHIQVLVGQCIVSPDFVVTAPTDTAFTVANGDIGDKWSRIEDLADGLGDVDVYDDGLRVWHVEPRPTLAATPDLVLVDGVGGTVVQKETTTDRESWANRVVLFYRWNTSAGAETIIQAVRSITTGPHAAVAGNVKSWSVERTRMPTTQARADLAAASLVKRKASGGRVHTVRAVAVPWLRPGMTVTVTTRLGSARYLVSAVVFDGMGWMELSTRYPDSTMTIGP